MRKHSANDVAFPLQVPNHFKFVSPLSFTRPPIRGSSAGLSRRASCRRSLCRSGCTYGGEVSCTKAEHRPSRRLRRQYSRRSAWLDSLHAASPLAASFRPGTPAGSELPDTIPTSSTVSTGRTHDYECCPDTWRLLSHEVYPGENGQVEVISHTVVTTTPPGQQSANGRGPARTQVAPQPQPASSARCATATRATVFPARTHRTRF